MNDFLIIKDDKEVNNIISRLLTQGFYKDFVFSKGLILDLIHYANERDISLTNKVINRIINTIEIEPSILINSNNFTSVFNIKNKRTAYSMIEIFIKKESFLILI